MFLHELISAMKSTFFDITVSYILVYRKKGLGILFTEPLDLCVHQRKLHLTFSITSILPYDHRAENVLVKNDEHLGIMKMRKITFTGHINDVVIYCLHTVTENSNLLWEGTDFIERKNIND